MEENEQLCLICILVQIIMWMLREDQGIVNTVVKLIKFFPSRLPQYHECVSKCIITMPYLITLDDTVD